MSWAVVGGSGFVGAAVLDALTAAGIDARTVPAPRLTTEAESAAALVAEAHRYDVGALGTALRGHDVVVNAAGMATPSAPAGPELLGANALLPAVVACAAARAGVHRVIHLSSAAVQGSARRLDETTAVQPFSAYSRSKALGEQALTALDPPELSVVILRATSVQGHGRPTTASLAKLARSPLASVAAPGTAPSPVTSVGALADLVVAIGRHGAAVPGIVLQPWEGLSVRTVLEAAGGRPRLLPAVLCRTAVSAGFRISSLLGGRLDGQVRRVELLWFGQDQVPGWAAEQGLAPRPAVRDVLARAGRGDRAGR
ncbi:NAD(P)-dependent oxidoreductase [uncultured Arthrobacter sp.]|uniref:NAD-dependent epimerase/dehydratase family protein n=1 Tax=uncultured Arthrobacter sp. TaxID=114050 RepID=UPI0026120CDF|nr:NAD-dependent epimerase/dehydratase family protein [uncultured Arthrobacter sp.]